MNITDLVTYTIGFGAQLLFSWRMVDQWISSERKRKTQIPKQFWTHSLVASFLLCFYGWLRHDFAIVLGQFITYYIYIRNIQLQQQRSRRYTIILGILACFPVITVYALFSTNDIHIDRFFHNEAIPMWLLVMGVVGQVIFTLRFVYQWVYSEKRKQSVLPQGFWIISLTGSLLILLYGIIRKDPVLIVAQLFGFVVYLRNIIIIKRNINSTQQS